LKRAWPRDRSQIGVPCSRSGEARSDALGVHLARGELALEEQIAAQDGGVVGGQQDSEMVSLYRLAGSMMVLKLSLLVSLSFFR
jgi:hypothetical protein